VDACQLSDNHRVQSIFLIVLIAAIVLFIIGGVVSSVGEGSIYDQIGQGGLSMDRDTKHRVPPPDSSGESSERELEIRQMLQARSERRVRQGGEPLDVDAELAALLDPHPDSAGDSPSSSQDTALTEEVRQLVIARNHRRERRGEQPLDVDSEVARKLAELDSSS
jgi:hypothetical protein